MKKKINLQFLIMSVTAIILTLVISTLVSYEVLKDEVMEDLHTYARVLVETGAFSDMDHISYDAKEDGLRVTVIAEDGSVEYDSNANASDMDNHEKRPEIEAAIESGEGSTIRRSSTLERSMFYYAVRLDNGNVLRVAKESDNVLSIMSSTFPLLLGLAVVLFAVGALFSHLLTKSIVAPVEQMANDMDHLESIRVYKELRPFITTIQKQHEDIRKNADMRQEFTANVSHELKTPMTSMKVLADSLIQQGDQVPAELYREFMQDIVAEIDRENVIISDLLSLVKLDKKAAQLQITTVSINELLEIIMKRLKPLALQRNIELIFESFRPVTAEIDEVKLSLGLTNLIENGIKYNKDDGWIRVTLNADHKYFYVKVADSGVGIPEDCQDQVFDRFYRVDKARSRDTGGTGLGLAITKSVVSLHNGEIKLYSKVGEGTTFTLRIPLKYKG